jgi:hypothetical protein
MEEACNKAFQAWRKVKELINARKVTRASTNKGNEYEKQ